MLDVAMIKSTPKAADAPREHGKKPENREATDGQKQEFQAEYDAARDTEKQATSDKASDDGREIKPEVADTDAPAQGDDALIEAEAIEVPAEVFEVDKVAASADRNPAPSAVTGQEPAQTTPMAATPPQEHGDEPVARTVKDDATAPKANGPVSEIAGQIKAAENRPAVAKTTAETIISSKALENASQTAIAKDKGALPPDARPAAAAAAEHRNIPQPLQNFPVAEPQTGRKSEGRRADRAEEALLKSVQAQIDAAPKPPTAPAPNAAQNAAGLAQADFMKIQAPKDKADAAPGLPLDLEAVGQWESRTATQTSSTSLPQVLGRPETPGMIARQMAEALQKLPDRPVEISLNPRELGRVRMSISAAEAGITVSVIAERPETLDLMRRNIDQLTREFQTIGYESINFAFSEGGARNDFSDRHAEGAGIEATRLELTVEDDAHVPVANTILSSGVDIRL